MHRLGLIVSVLLLVSCGASQGTGNEDGGVGNGGDDGGGGGGGNVADANDDCEAPDMLLLVDRTMSMHRDPEGARPPNTPEGHASSKWSIAVNSIQGVTTALDDGIRFGLALFPVDPGGNQCVTLEERITNITATNDACQQGEVLVSPAINSGPDIDSAISVDMTRLCTSTPIGAGLETARDALASLQSSARKQFAVLLTDGEDTCDETLALATVQEMADADVKSYIIGFGGNGVDNGLLNDLACAGQTATGFPAPCTDDGAGHFTATDRDGTPLYQLAEDAAQLTATLEGFAGEVCCDCID